MQFNKKILLVTLCLSLHGAIMSMETTPTLDELTLEGLKQHTNHISQYLADFNPEQSKQNILPLANWLVQQRSTTTETDTWNNLIKKLEDHVQIPTCTMLKLCQRQGADVIDVLKITECVTDRYHFTCSLPHMFAKIIINQAYQLQPDTNGEELFQSIELVMKKALAGLLSKTFVDASF